MGIFVVQTIATLFLHWDTAQTHVHIILCSLCLRNLHWNRYIFFFSEDTCFIMNHCWRTPNFTLYQRGPQHSCAMERLLHPTTKLNGFSKSDTAVLLWNFVSILPFAGAVRKSKENSQIIKIWACENMWACEKCPTSDLLLVGIEFTFSAFWNPMEIKGSEPNMIWGCLFFVFFTVKQIKENCRDIG